MPAQRWARSVNQTVSQLAQAPTLPFDPPRQRARATQLGTQSVEETARRYGISRGVAYELARRGELPGVIRLGRRLVVARAITDRVLGQEGGAGR